MAEALVYLTQRRPLSLIHHQGIISPLALDFAG